MTSPSRRSFLVGSAGVVFTIPLFSAACSDAQHSPYEVTNSGGLQDAWVHIDPSGAIRIRAAADEMGQGSLTAQPVIFAEELDADWNDVTVEFSDPDELVFGNPQPWTLGMMLTAGSSAVPGYFDKLRMNGAQVRKYLLGVAAKQWQVPIETLITQPSRIIHEASSRTMTYGEAAGLADETAVLPDLSPDELKSPSEFRLIGRDIPRRDVPSKIDGSAQYAIDIVVPDMVHATIVRAPTIEGRVVRVYDRQALAIDGVIEVVQLDDIVAVIANTYFAALEGERALSIDWSQPEIGGDLNSSEMLETLVATARDLTSSGAPIQDTGDIESAFAEASIVHAAEYRAEHVYHAQMEPLGAVASVMDQGQKVEIWAGTQAPSHLLRSVSTELGIEKSAISLNRLYSGGGFGRRTTEGQDYILDAVRLSRHLARPVKVTWSREADVRAGCFRPMAGQVVRVAEDQNGDIAGWHHRIAAQSTLRQADPFRFTRYAEVPYLSSAGVDTFYSIPSARGEILEQAVGARVAPLRGVSLPTNEFAAESMMNEVARAKQIDPIEFRKIHLAQNWVAMGVLEAVEKISPWQERPGLGVSLVSHGGFRYRFS
ncbi:MAG: molybdopterin cofactor-binding domain-containing protein [Pseudomonadota bacterium]